jgi:hypothetical protein
MSRNRTFASAHTSLIDEFDPAAEADTLATHDVEPHDFNDRRIAERFGRQSDFFDFGMEEPF